MAIDRLNSTAALIAALRENVVARTGASPRTSGASRTPADASGARAPSRAQLRRQLVDIARAVDLGDPVAVGQARTRFIRAILLWEFGPELREHPDWQALTQGIEHALDAGATARDGFVDLLRRLRSGKAG